MERLPFKANVRKLKEFGLTISLEIGYEISMRGRAVYPRRFREIRVKGVDPCQSTQTPETRMLVTDSTVGRTAEARTG